MKADITVNANGTGTLALDGVPVESAVTGFNLNVRGHQTRPALTLDMLITEKFSIGGDIGLVEVDPATYELLIRLGWTPPVGDP